MARRIVSSRNSVSVSFLGPDLSFFFSESHSFPTRLSSCGPVPGAHGIDEAIFSLLPATLRSWLQSLYGGLIESAGTPSRYGVDCPPTSSGEQTTHFFCCSHPSVRRDGNQILAATRRNGVKLDASDGKLRPYSFSPAYGRQLSVVRRPLPRVTCQLPVASCHLPLVRRFSIISYQLSDVRYHLSLVTGH